jgi:ribose/xylose/arabinose/galactoside ABC-type transport system permease subunit
MSEVLPPSAPPTPQRPAAAPQLARRRLPRLQEFGLIIVTLLLCLFLYFQAESITWNFPAREVTLPGGQTKMLPEMTVSENKFLNTGNLVPIVLTQMSWMAIMAIGMTMVIISGGIDISVGSVMGFAALSCAAVLQSLPESTSPALVLLLGIGVPLGVGLACGLVNGLIIVWLRMHPFIVTLATLSIFRWSCLKMAREGSLPSGDNVLHPAFTDHFVAWQIRYAKFGGHQTEALQPVPLLIMLTCLVAGWVYLRHTVWGRETYAIGGNEEAARFSGISVKWAKVRVYMISGLCAGIAGMLTCGYFKSAATNTGQGYELVVVAAAVVGGASLSGGRGTALGAVLGMLVMQLIDNGMSVLNKVTFSLFGHQFLSVPVKKEDTQLIYGVSIIVAVAIDQLSRLLQDRRLARSKSK